MEKYTDARYPEKINDLIDNEGQLSEEGKEVIKESGVAPSPEEIEELVKIGIEADKDILDKLEIDTESDPDYVIITFPKGIMPMSMDMNVVTVYPNYMGCDLVTWDGESIGWTSCLDRIISWSIQKEFYGKIVCFSYGYYNGNPDDSSNLPNFAPVQSGTKLYKHILQDVFNTEIIIIDNSPQTINDISFSNRINNALSLYTYKTGNRATIVNYEVPESLPATINIVIFDSDGITDNFSFSVSDSMADMITPF